MKNPLSSLKLKYRKWQVNRSLRVLDALDWNMKRAGWSRRDRRQFWRDFIKKQGFRMGVFNKLTQE